MSKPLEKDQVWEWEEGLLLMSILPDLWLAMNEYGYLAVPTTEIGV